MSDHNEVSISWKLCIWLVLFAALVTLVVYYLPHGTPWYIGFASGALCGAAATIITDLMCA